MTQLVRFTNIEISNKSNQTFPIPYTIAKFGERTASLSPISQVLSDSEQWRTQFESRIRIGMRGGGIISVEFGDEDELDEDNLQQATDNIYQSFNQWFNSDKEIKKNLNHGLNSEDDILFLMGTEKHDLRKIPWQSWDFLQNYDHQNSEIALTKSDFDYDINQRRNYSSPVFILVVFGSSKSSRSEEEEPIDLTSFEKQIRNVTSKGVKIIDSNTPADLSSQLKNSNSNDAYIILTKPKNLEDLSRYIRHGCDIFCYIGHSESEENSSDGYIYLENKNQQSEQVRISKLKQRLNQARNNQKNPLQLAIFTSCQGFGLATVLDQLNVPNIIAMRALLPVEVGKVFLDEFLDNFIVKKLPLHLAVRNTREILGENFGHEYPGVQWLPQLFCHPNAAENILTWDKLIGTKRISLKTSVLTSLMVTFLMIILRSLGFLQSWELNAYDHLMRTKPEEKPDPRLLIVGVDDNDLKKYGYIPSDETLAKVLDKLKDHQPAVIGLDIVRDLAVEPGYESLIEEYKNPNFIAMCWLGNENSGFEPPEKISRQQVGFVDLYPDEDSKIRRYSTYRTTNEGRAKSTRCYRDVNYAFGSLLAKKYLESQGQSVNIKGENLQFGSVIIKKLQPRSAGYQKNMDAKGNLMMINYRKTPDININNLDPNQHRIAQQVTINDILTDKFDPNWVKSRIVFIGYTAEEKNDFQLTPYGDMSGVHIHAHVVSQIISAVEDNRPLLKSYTWWQDGLLILLFSSLGGVIICYISKPILQLGTVIIFIPILSGICWFFFIQGFWIPFIPSGLALFFTQVVLVAIYYRQIFIKKTN